MVAKKPQGHAAQRHERQEPCTVDGCDKLAAPDRGMCWAHQKRSTRRQGLSRPLDQWGSAPWHRVVEAALALADAEDDDDAWERGQRRLRGAVLNWVAKRKRFGVPGNDVLSSYRGEPGRPGHDVLSRADARRR